MDDIKNIRVLEPASKDVDLGEMFTNEFREYAKANNKTYVLLQWEKDKPEEALFDHVNCESAFKAFKQAIKALGIELKTVSIKEEK